MRRKLFIETTKERKNIGWLHERTYYKKVKSSKHLYNTLNAWGIDAEAFELRISKECDSIKILDTETNVLYELSVSLFKALAIYKHHKPHRPQMFVKLRDWGITENYKNDTRNHIQQG